MLIDRDVYLRYALELNREEIRMQAELLAWLPNPMIDCHVHTTPHSCVEHVEEAALQHMNSTFPSFSLEESQAVNALLYPGVTLHSVRFPKPSRGIDHRRANEFLLAEVPPDDRVAIFGLPEDVTYTQRTLAHPRAAALKMYHTYCTPRATSIYGYFPPAILEVAQSLGKAIILHLHSPLLHSWADLQRLLTDFPRLKVVLAHMGLCTSPYPGMEKMFDELVAHENLFMDTSFITSAATFTVALRTLGPSRIMYGSDQPLNLIRARPFLHPTRGTRLITEFPYHWVNAEEHEQYRHLAKGCVQFHWQSLAAIKNAFETDRGRNNAEGKISLFYGTAKAVYQF